MVISDEASLAAEAAVHMSEVIGCKVHDHPAAHHCVTVKARHAHCHDQCTPRLHVTV